MSQQGASRAIRREREMKPVRGMKVIKRFGDMEIGTVVRLETAYSRNALLPFKTLVVIKWDNPSKYDSTGDLAWFRSKFRALK